MPRSLWTGSITFGLVNVPVRIYSAIEEHKLHFHFLHTKDDSPIGYQKVCKKEDKAVPDDEIVKAFEYSKGEYVVMEDEDFEAAQAAGYKTIDISDFVPYEQVDPIFFAKTYYVGPQEGAEKVYSLLVQAMEDSELAAVTKFVMRDKQHLGLLRVRQGVITLEQLYFADEIRSIKEIKASKRKVGRGEIQMAQESIESFTGEWKPGQYKDTYRNELMKVIRAKRKGKEIHRAPEVEEQEPPDLMEALRQSLEAAQSGRRPKRRARQNGGSSSSDGLKDLSKGELEKRAKKADIPGRSSMSKDELAAALAKAS